jgi:hypothetical protein
MGLVKETAADFPNKIAMGVPDLTPAIHGTH